MLDGGDGVFVVMCSVWCSPNTASSLMAKKNLLRIDQGSSCWMHILSQLSYWSLWLHWHSDSEMFLYPPPDLNFQQPLLSSWCNYSQEYWLTSKWTFRHRYLYTTISWDTFTALTDLHFTNSETTSTKWLDLCWIRSVTLKGVSTYTITYFT